MPPRGRLSLDPGTRRWSEALSQEIAQHPGSREQVLRLVLRELRCRLSLDAALTYGVSVPGDALQLEFALDLDFRGGGENLLRRHLHGRPRTRWGYFNPSRPEPAQRNKVLSLREDLAQRVRVAPSFEAAAHEAGVHQLDQVRVLICEGPALLAWLGGFRRETVSEAERAAFASIIPALRKRLVLEQSVGQARLRTSALDVVLEALSCAAFLIREEDGGILLSNTAGRALLDSDGVRIRDRLRASLADPQGATGVELTPFPVPGERDRLLALVRPASVQDSVARARVLGARWGLTPRHVEVLERLAWGASNKAIAAHLGCAEGTVELHVAAMMRRAEASSRAELIARFWTAPAGL